MGLTLGDPGAWSDLGEPVGRRAEIGAAAGEENAAAATCLPRLAEPSRASPVSSKREALIKTGEVGQIHRR